MKFWLILLPLFVLSCEPIQLNPEDVRLEKIPYYDLNSLIKRQIKYLSAVSPEVQIKATVNGTQEQQKVEKSDSVFWARTLSLVNKANINQPALRGIYAEKDSVIKNTSENLRLKTFYPKEKRETDVLYLNIYYDSTLSQIQQLETIVRDKNLLYVTERKMKLSFETYQGQSRITQYEVLGKQKIIFGDTIHFTTVVTPTFHN